MAVLLIVVGLGWALLGAGNFIGTLGMQIDKPVPSELMVTASLLFNVLLFIFPGLGLAGIGGSWSPR
jgi:hypothetical protein